MEAREVADDSLTEGNITWNNQPAYGRLLDTTCIDTFNQWYSWDATPFIRDELIGDKVASICLKPENESEGAAYRWSIFWSKEYAGFEPHLLVAYGPLPSVSVTPPTRTVRAGDTFTINVTASNVTGLYGYEFKLYYDNAILDVSEVIEGPFLKTHGSTFFVYDVDASRIHVGVSLMGPPLGGVNGTGTLATISFKTTAPGSTVLDLRDTKLGDPEANMIIHDVIDGFVEIGPGIPGDVNFDGIVDIFDACIVGAAFGCKPGDPDWNPLADLKPDNIIDIFDLIIVGVNFGRTT